MDFKESFMKKAAAVILWSNHLKTWKKSIRYRSVKTVWLVILEMLSTTMRIRKRKQEVAPVQMEESHQILPEGPLLEASEYKKLDQLLMVDQKEAKYHRTSQFAKPYRQLADPEFSN
jgi:hypothetical protein